MVSALPEDILHLLCAELYQRRDFDTLFQCCSTSKTLAFPALTALYRAQHFAPAKADSGNETLGISLADQELLVRKWSILWRTIILSSLGKTVLPYCMHLRVLDLDDLKLLLEDDRFRGDISRNFFSGDLAHFNVPFDTPTKTRSGRQRAPRLNINHIIDAVGELITQHAPMLEVINGPLLANALVRWIPRVPNLRSLQVWDGKALNDERVSGLIREHCPKFEALAFYTWLTENGAQIDPGSDEKLAAFFSGLPEQSLTSFTTYSRTGFGPQSCLMLNSHGKSLGILDLQLDSDVIPQLGFLKGCTALETLRLTDNTMAENLEATQHDVFLEIIAWLLDCRNLHTLSLNGFTSGAALATPVLMDQHIHLEQLEVVHYAAKDQNDFHKALTHQPHLQKLTLESEQIEFRDGLEILTHSLCQLKELRMVRLIAVTAMFSNAHISAICENLELIEDLYVGGLCLGDDTLESISLLKNLKSVVFAGITTFSFDHLLAFVRSLGPGNRGLVLAIDNADPDQGLSAIEQNFVRTELVQKVDGRLEYTFFRDPDISEFEGDSD